MNWQLTAKKLRLPLGFLLAALYLAFARPEKTSLIIGGTIALIGVLAFFVLIYMPTMERERVMTGKRFPDLYPDYEKNVPAFIPRLTPWQGPQTPTDDAGAFSFDLYMKHGEWKAALGYVGAMAWLLFRLRSGL